MIKKLHSTLNLLTSIVTFLFMGALIPTTHAANSWDGSGGDGFWNTANNWDNDTVPTTSQNLTFSGDVQTTTTNNIASFTVGSGLATTYSINFGNTGAVGTNAFTLAGNQITLASGSSTGGSIISSNVTVGLITDTISLNMNLSGNGTISTGSAHNLIITGLLTQSSGTKTLVKTGSGELILRNAGNTYLGATSINSGTLTVDVAGGIKNAGISSALGAGTAGANSQINFTGGTLNVALGAGSTDRQVRIGSSTATSTGGANINNNSANGSNPLLFSNAGFNVSAGSITVNRVLTLGGTNTDANEISGAISDNNTAGGGIISVTKAGSGLWILSGTNSYSGSTTVGGAAGSSNGVLRIASVSSLPPNTTIVGSAGADTTSTLELAPGSYSVKNYNKGNINFVATSGQATLAFTNTEVTNTLTQGAGNKTIYSSNVAVRFAGSLDISAVADSSTNKTATFSGNGDFTFNGPIIGAAVTNWTVVGTNGSNSIITSLSSNSNTIVSTNYFTTGFIMNSTGAAALNASNTYAGATDVKQGTLQVNGSISTNTLSISNGATLAGLGTVGGAVFVSGNLQPGRGATNGALTIRGNLTVDTNGIVNLSIDSLAEYDRLAGASSYTVDGTINVAAGTTYSPADGNTFQLFSGAVGGTPTLNVTPLSNPNYVWVTNNFTSTGQISVARATSDLTPPVITVVGANPLTVAQGSVYSDAGATTDDGSAVTANIPASITSTLGSKTVTYDSVDGSGNHATQKTRTVNVTDQTAPVLALNGANPLFVSWGGAFTDPGASFTDNVDASKTVISLNTVDTSKVGSTILTYSAVDAGGNAAVNVTRTVTVTLANGGTTVGVDGLSDLMRYALGGTSPSSKVELPTVAVTSTTLTMSALIRIDDLKVSVVGIYGLVPGSWVTGSPITGVPSSNQTGAVAGVTQRQDFTVLRGTDPTKFMYLKATQQTP